MTFAEYSHFRLSYIATIQLFHSCFTRMSKYLGLWINGYWSLLFSWGDTVHCLCDFSSTYIVVSCFNSLSTSLYQTVIHLTSSIVISLSAKVYTFNLLISRCSFFHWSPEVLLFLEIVCSLMSIGQNNPAALL